MFPYQALDPADIFEADGVTPKANPFTADVNGFFFFLAENGRYDIRLSGGGIVTPYVWADVLLADLGAGGISVAGQSLFGGSRSAMVDVTLTPQTLPAVDWNPVVIPANSEVPADTVVTAYLSAQVGAGSSVVLKIVDADTDVVILEDPTPFTDDTQMVEHAVVLPLPGVRKLGKLVATVTDGVGLPLLFLGDLRYAIDNP